jgi:creatinine amidohydrolase
VTAAAANLPLRIKELTPEAARAVARDNPRLIVPAGTTEHHGVHLPLGCDTIIVERFADDLSAEFRVLRAPAIEYGVNDDHGRPLHGSAGVRRKTLRRWVNDLLPDWEQLGVTDILILTMNGFAPHTEALSTVVPRRARVRTLDLLAIDLSTLVDYPEDPVQGSEVDTSLLLFIRPELVRMDLAVDCILPDEDLRRYRRGSALALPAVSAGSVGRTTTASADKGRRIYAHILDRIRQRVFAAPMA